MFHKKPLLSFGKKYYRGPVLTLHDCLVTRRVALCAKIEANLANLSLCSWQFPDPSGSHCNFKQGHLEHELSGFQSKYSRQLAILQNRNYPDVCFNNNMQMPTYFWDGKCFALYAVLESQIGTVSSFWLEKCVRCQWDLSTQN